MQLPVGRSKTWRNFSLRVLEPIDRRRTAMPANYDVITFDCYGTLIDWNRGIGEALAAAAHDSGVALDQAQALGAYHAVEPAVQSARYRPYREVLAETARQVAARLGWALDEAAAQ